MSDIDPRARIFAALGGLSGFLGVAAGAFGTHTLRDRLPAALLAAFETGARYQLVHALALIAVAWALDRTRSPAVAVAGWLFVAGSVLFSGSLYALALAGAPRFGLVTPFGGVCLLAGWLVFAVGTLRAR
jgi:uncharacterized membrane protein YgdD (TMEM256/DUF423 family)